MICDATDQLGEPGAAGDEREAQQMLAGDEQAAGADSEENDEDQRSPEGRGTRRGRRDRERQESDRIDKAERDDRERDRLQPELHAPHPAERPDLDR